ncbi:hypothetical protein B0A55_07737 [Friedmanniomyces simplex]|uniref:Uncharacterized protein n=1 Tax=Friedmanniomyces simplex TaxID=329884 RepID=A0A4U0WZD2_9PEZI|nr:hypothetical protein B0A55_07737 [Friedmanniomyces simplex]
MAALDPELAAAYRDAYAEASTRNLASAALLTASKLSRAAVKPTSTSTAAVAATETMASVDMTASGFLAKLLWLLFLFLTWPLRWFHSAVILPLLTGIWSGLLWLLSFLFWAGIALALVFLIIRGHGYRHWLRERYDDFALDNRVLLNLEHGWTSFKRAMFDRWLSLRYNETGDAIVRFYYEAYFLPDTIERAVRRNLGKLFLLCALAGWIWYARSVNGMADESTSMYEGPLPFDRTFSVPAWVLATSKSVGSNCHYTPEPRVLVAVPVPYEKWVAAVGGEGDEIVGLASGTTGVRGVSSLLKTVTETKTETETTTITVRERISQPPKTETTTVTICETDDGHTHTRPEKATDYWAPPSGGRTTLDDEEMRWCRECQQYHGSELPY